MARTEVSESNSKQAVVASHDQNQYLTFVLGGETFAIGILGIKEILEYEPPTDVPMMPKFIRGIVNLRGSVVPVIDLCARFGKPSSPVNKRTCIIILETVSNEESQVLGVVVDAVNEVLEIPGADIEPPPSFGASVRTDFIGGMGRVRDRFVIILNVGNVLSIEEMDSIAFAADSAQRH